MQAPDVEDQTKPRYMIHTSQRFFKVAQYPRKSFFPRLKSNSIQFVRFIK